MKCYRALTAVSLAMVCSPLASPGASAAGLPVVTEGRSDYRIVVGAKAAEPERFAAEELSRYLEQISGARLPISATGSAEARGDHLILLGSAAPAAITGELSKQPPDTFLIRTQDAHLILAGERPRATLYAVYAFLESLGCGWSRPGQSYLLQQLEQPGPQEETIPRQTTITVSAAGKLEKPAFKYRALILFPLIKDRTLREIDWMAKNRFNWGHICTNTEIEDWEKHEVDKTLIPAMRKRGIQLEGIGHSFFAYIPPEKYAADHPEYFAMSEDGKREIAAGRGGLCVSNPDVVKLMAANMDAFLKKNPSIDIIDLWTNDSAVWCHCPKCKEMQGVSLDTKVYKTSTRSYLRFVNQVAELLEKTHPDKQINALAYALNTIPDPETRPRDNVIVGIAPWGRVTYGGSDDYYTPITEPGPVNTTLLPAIQGWLKLTQNFYLYDYYGNRSEYFPIVDTLRKDYAYYKSLGMSMISSEIYLWPEFNMWAYGRLAWDEKMPLRKIAEDFCRIAYRGSAEPMVNFHLSLERYKWEWVQHRPRLRALLVKARELAANDPTVRGKIERMGQILERDPGKTWPHSAPPPPLEGEDDKGLFAKVPGEDEAPLSLAAMASPSPEASAPPVEEPSSKYFLRTGDRVVFLGDSITQRAIYTGYIEKWVRAFHPELQVQFFNAGKGSDNADDGLRRLEADVFAHSPSVVVLCYGMNDAVVRTPNADVDPKRLKTYIDSHREIVRVLRSRRARPFFMTSPPARHNLTGELEGHNRRLEVFAQELQKLAAELKVPVVDIFHPMLEQDQQVHKFYPGQYVIPDGVHPDESGNMIMARAVLKAWGLFE